MPRQCARWIFDGYKFSRDVAINWDAGRIQQLSPIESTATLPNLLLIPGLINLHAHLELTALDGKVQALRQETTGWNEDAFERSYAQGIRQSLAAGTTTVLDVGNSSAGWHSIGQQPLRLLAMRELLSLQESVAMARLQQAEQQLVAMPVVPSDVGLRGFSPHAPYSCHPKLLSTLAADHGCVLPLTIHLSESVGEQQLYTQATGSFRNWLDGIAPGHPFGSPMVSGLAWLEAHGISARSIFVHGNLLTDQELAQLQSAGGWLVHCPQSARWFGHPLLDVPACVAKGISVCLGTDSLASAESLSLWEQMALLHQTWPQMSVEAVLAMVTRNPGSALQAWQHCGVLEPGALADWVMIEVPEGFDGEDWSWLFAGTPRIHGVVIAGEQRNIHEE